MNFKYLVIFSCFAVILSNRTGVSIDRTGSPNAFGTTCNGCHNGGEFSGNIDLLGLPNYIKNGDTLNLSLTVSNTNARGAGFQVVAIEQSSNEYVGEWIAGQGSKAAGSIGLTHQGPRGFIDNQGDWKFSWIAPNEGGPFTFYYVVNLINANNTTSGDNAISGSSNVLLPVNYSSIHVFFRDNSCFIQWSTMTEINNKFFEVQKMSNDGNFITIGKVMANENGSKNGYVFVDKNITKGTSYYRIKQIDKDGNYSFSNIHSITFEDAFELYDFWYNSFTKNIIIKENNNLDNHNRLQLYDQYGRLLVSAIAVDQLDVSAYPKGIYFVKLSTLTNESVRTIYIY